MIRKQLYLDTGIIIALISVISLAGCNFAPIPGVGPTQPASPPHTIPTIHIGNDLQPPNQTLSPTASKENGLQSVFKSFSLPDPNTVCLNHYLNGISCLDAAGWHIYQDGNLPRRIVHCPDGRIYLVDDEFYLYQIEEDVIERFEGWLDQGIIACGIGDEIWVSDLSEVMRFDGSTWISYSVEDYFDSHDDEWPDSIHSLAVAPNGNAWVTTANTIFTFDGVDWQVVAPPGNFRFDESSIRSQRLLVDPSGNVWIAASSESCCPYNNLLKFDGAEWSTFPGPDDEIHDIQNIAMDSQNRIWAATTGSKIFLLNQETKEWLMRFDLQQLGAGNQWESTFGAEKLGLGLGDVNRINQMEFDGQGRLWVTTDYGVGIYDGEIWTIYHTYTANLYMNDISDLSILGDGPQLPALEIKSFGSIQGKLVSETQSPFTDALVAICVREYTGMGYCADQAENINADGSFVISNVPAGTYYLRFKLSNEWYYLTMPPPEGYACTPYCTGEFSVEEGQETNLGEISDSYNSNSAASPIPTQTTIPDPNGACTGSSGSWSTQPDGVLSVIFTIEDCKITTVFIQGFINGQWLIVSNEANQPIIGSDFNLIQTFSDQDRYNLSGTFTSPTSASIQLVIYKGFRFTTDQPSPLNEDLIINATATLGND